MISTFIHYHSYMNIMYVDTHPHIFQHYGVYIDARRGGLFYPSKRKAGTVRPLQPNAHFCLFLKFQRRNAGDPPRLNPGFLL